MRAQRLLRVERDVRTCPKGVQSSIVEVLMKASVGLLPEIAVVCSGLLMTSARKCSRSKPGATGCGRLDGPVILRQTCLHRWRRLKLLGSLCIRHHHG